MDRHIPVPRFRLEADAPDEQSHSQTRTSTAPSNATQAHYNARAHFRTRQSPCSDLQSIAIPEERVYQADDLSKMSTDNRRSSTSATIKLSRQRCQSQHKSLDCTSTVPLASLQLTDPYNRRHEDDEVDEDEINYHLPPRANYRYSLPDASPASLALRNILKRNRTTKPGCLTSGLPSHSSHSLSASLSTTNSSSPIATFRHFLSLVKLPSTKSGNSTASHHSSLTTLTNATSSSSTTLDQTTSSIPPTMQWHFETSQSQWSSSDGISKITLGSIELHNFTYVEHKQLREIVLQRLQSTQYDLGTPIHVPKEETARKRKHHFLFRSKSNDKSKESKDAKSNGNVFGVALSQCVNDDEGQFQDEITLPPPITATGGNRKYSADTIDTFHHEMKTSPTGSISSTNDSGCSISPTSPSSLHISDSDYEQNKLRSVSLEMLGTNEGASSINRMKTLRCYPAKVPELIKSCCDYLEKNALQTVGLFRVGVSKKRLKELKDQINSSRSLTFDSSTNAHDVAGLIKEFLRELPEPLLTRDLCTPFLTIRTKLHPRDQSRALSYLISLLPSSHRDTLYTLLKFLHHISDNSQDRCSTDGKVLIAGNKMDAANLAIVFAPTILMDGKAPAMSTKETSVAMSADQMEQGKGILKMMIEQYKDLFMVPKDLHDEICLALYNDDPVQLMRVLAFKVQKGCGITSMQLDEENEQLLMTLDVTPIASEMTHSTSSLFAALIPRMNHQQLSDSGLRRYNLRRNSDFPCSVSHTSRSSEFLQVPTSSSQQRLNNPTHQSLSKLPRVRDIREASMDQIIFRVIDPQVSTSPRPNEPIINISSFDDTSTPSVVRPHALEVNESPSTAPLLREIKGYSRSKTAPLSSISGAPRLLTPKQREARDLCGSSSNDESRLTGPD